MNTKIKILAIFFVLLITQAAMLFATDKDEKKEEEAVKAILKNLSYDMAMDFTVVSPSISQPIENNQTVFMAVTLFHEDNLDVNNFKIFVNGRDITSGARIIPYYISYVWNEGIGPGRHNVVIYYQTPRTNFSVSEFSFVVQGDDEVEVEEGVSVAVEQYPLYPGGVRNMMNSLGNAIKFPSHIQRRSDVHNGVVVVNYVVTSNGIIRDPYVAQSLSPAYDDEVLQIVNTMPPWSPGLRGGRAVSFNYELIVEFRDTGAGRSVIIHQPRYLAD